MQKKNITIAVVIVVVILIVVGSVFAFKKIKSSNKTDDQKKADFSQMEEKRGKNAEQRKPGQRSGMNNDQNQSQNQANDNNVNSNSNSDVQSDLDKVKADDEQLDKNLDDLESVDF